MVCYNNAGDKKLLFNTGVYVKVHGFGAVTNYYISGIVTSALLLTFIWFGTSVRTCPDFLVMRGDYKTTLNPPGMLADSLERSQ